MYDVIIIGAGPGGIFSAYELMQKNKDLKIAVFDAGHSLEKRHCPIDGDKVKNCIKCKTCAIMNGFGVQALSLMENTISPTILVVLFMDISDASRRLISWSMLTRSICLTAAKELKCTLPPELT